MDASDGKDESEQHREHDQEPETLEDRGEGFSNASCGEPTLREMTSSERTQSFHQCLIPTCLAEKLIAPNASNNNAISHHSTNHSPSHAFRTSPSSTTGGGQSVANSNHSFGTGTPSISLSSALAQHAQQTLLQHLNNNTINNHKITDNHLSPKQSRSSIAPYSLGGRGSSSGVASSSTPSNSSQHLPLDDKSALLTSNSHSPAVSSVLLKLEQSGVNIGMLDQFVKNSNAAALNGLNVNSVAARLLEESLKIHRQQHQLQQAQAVNGESSWPPQQQQRQHRQGPHEEAAALGAESLGGIVDRHSSANANGDLSGVGVNDDVLMTNLDRNLNERGSARAVTSHNHLSDLVNHNNNDGEPSSLSFSGSVCETVDASTCSPSSVTTSSSSSSAAPSSSSAFGVECNNMSITSIVSGLGLNMVGPNITTSPGGSLDEHDCDEDKVINGDSFSPGDVPDPDAIKMFVGQVPKNLTETQLKTLFEEFGRVFQINVLRDKVTKQSKGCCFVTFYTRKAALDAQNALHNVKTLPGMNHPIQMKPADNENRYERKLFVGMLSKKCNETDVRNMFSRYGHIDECTVLRDLHGQSRGCAFITFASKQCAQSAIKALHHSITMEGCTSPLVVKFADTQKDKDQKRNQQLQSSMINNFSGPASGVSPMVPQQFFSELLVENILQQLQQQQQSNNYFSQLNSLGIQGIPGLAGLNSPNPAAALAGLTASHSSTANNDLATLAALANFSGVSPNQHSMVLGVQAALAAAAMGGNHASLSPSGASNGANGIGSTNSLASLSTGNSLPSGYNAYANALRSSAVNKQAEGPEGANLFIYHLPPEWSDADLISMFSNYGTVISAKVFIDKQTNLSKCFGFVSYDNGVSAQLAIQSMNGFQVGMKRLKVQLKRSKDAAKPY